MPYNTLLILTVCLVTVFSDRCRAQSAQDDATTNEILGFINNPDNIPGSCNAGLALSQMMTGIQEDVGARIHDQLVDIRDIQTVYIHSDGYECRLTTIWGNNPSVRGFFRSYKNVLGVRVYEWDGQQDVPTP